MARLLTSLLVVFSTLAESGVGNSLREKRQGLNGASIASAGAYLLASYVSRNKGHHSLLGHRVGVVLTKIHDTYSYIATARIQEDQRWICPHSIN